ncbi:unnamed protein product [Prorocentrum cordatum]|uniref:Apple domain-containing protein n=1 Tax=Prorocentrum cordatum TaxID=2364126 RepID=A0ABN9U6A4_9DINO|nr:unnamed protein product [Polarella glacialis]
MALPAAARGRAALALAVAAELSRPGAGRADKPAVGFRIRRGSCRTATDGEGTYTFAQPTTAADCERSCAEDAACVAYEVTYLVALSPLFDPGRARYCKIHTQAVMMADRSTNRSECWVKEGLRRRRDFALLGTGYCLTASGERFRVAAWDVAPPGSFAHHFQCRTACDAESACTAYELRKVGGKLGCKVYTDPITQVEPCEAGRDCWCWVVRPTATPAPAQQSGESKFW